jgi:hypothetical protein
MQKNNQKLIKQIKCKKVQISWVAIFSVKIWEKVFGDQFSIKTLKNNFGYFLLQKVYRGLKLKTWGTVKDAAATATTLQPQKFLWKITFLKSRFQNQKVKTNLKKFKNCR